MYRLGLITNPNIAIFGQIGRGKSSFVKTFLFRQAAFGRRIVVLDPKGEYAELARVLGCIPVVLSPGGKVRLNPLALDEALGERSDQRRGCLYNATVVATAVLGRELSPGEHLAVELAIDQILAFSRPTLGLLAESLLAPDVRAVTEIGSTVAEIRDEGKAVAFELRRFVTGELSGIFDSERDEGLEFESDVAVIDLSAIYRSDALGPAVACVQLAVEARLRAELQRQTLMVVDEAWAVLSNPGAARFLQSSFKLARSLGVANVVVAHRVSDLGATGSDGSVVAQLSKGLLADCETVVCYAQSEQEVDACSAALGLSGVERALLPTLRRGSALWHVGQGRFLVEHRLSRFERDLVDTDQAMTSR
jgi:type IV secretory pathway VirB4 component